MQVLTAGHMRRLGLCWAVLARELWRLRVRHKPHAADVRLRSHVQRRLHVNVSQSHHRASMFCEASLLAGCLVTSLCTCLCHIVLLRVCSMLSSRDCGYVIYLRFYHTGVKRGRPEEHRPQRSDIGAIRGASRSQGCCAIAAGPHLSTWLAHCALL